LDILQIATNSLQGADYDIIHGIMHDINTDIT
jgi:hypothetical protein